ncbi:MAG TPA: gamma-glutamyltransferase family protein [Candidatus Binatia bacterium]|nr:gamma-glutamyltransferase family protein [Candidatus Binatia bacterium]
MFDKQSLKRIAAPFVALVLIACATASGPLGEPAREGGGEAMAAAANPHAVEAALEILRAGGAAVDAAIAAELVLGLVEPQSSGVGGGGFLVHYDGASENIIAYDGRERAPAGARPDMFMGANGEPLRTLDAQNSGRAIGGPSLIAMLKMAHEDHGRLPWARLFEPAIRLAETGFEVSPRMARILASTAERGRLRRDPAARAYLFDRRGRPHPAGHLLRNPQYASTLRAIAEEGPRALSEGPIAEAIVAAARREPLAGTLTLSDLQSIRPRRLEPVCGAFRVYRVCTAGPPSSGNAVLAILGLYQRARPQPQGPGDAGDWAAFMWASRLAYADRDHYMADDQFAPVPTRELVAPAYLDERARLIDLSRAPARVEPGMPVGRELFDAWGRVQSNDAGTTHLSVVDQWGNAVSLTATIEAAYGSQRMAAGFFLNNQLTDFSYRPTLNGRPVANAAAPHKAPRSSMSPTIVTDRNGELVLVIGSPGGSAIIGYVARATVGILDWGLAPQTAIDLSNATARLPTVNVENERAPAGVLDALRERGWELRDVSGLEESGLHAILVTEDGLVGGADPRREGVVGRVPAQHE